MINIHSSNFGTESAVRCTTKKGAYYTEPHIHQFPEIVLVKSGTLSVTVDGRTETARAGDVLFIGSFQTHTMRGSEDADIWICVFSNDFISDFNTNADVYSIGQRAVFTPSEATLKFLTDRLVDSGEKFISFDKTIYRFLKAGIYAAYEEYSRTVPYHESYMKSDQQSTIRKIMIYISNHFREDVSLASLAKDLGYNPEYLSHVISSIKDFNFRFLLNSFRIDYAKNLLSSTRRTIPDIAAESGFSGERSFHRVFKSMVGKTPGEFRENWVSPYFTTGKEDVDPSKLKTRID